LAAWIAAWPRHRPWLCRQQSPRPLPRQTTIQARQAATVPTTRSTRKLATLSVVVVTHDHRDVVGPALGAIAGELRDGDELIVVDNGSADGTPEAVRESAPRATLVFVLGSLPFGLAIVGPSFYWLFKVFKGEAANLT